MKNKFLIFYLQFIILFIIMQMSCKRGKNENNIRYTLINKEYILLRDVDALQQSNDSISMYVDSILNGLIDAEIISTGKKSFDLNNDNQTDIQFEIIDLNVFNNGNLPSYLDSMAARVIPVNLQILDNSTYGYPDAIDADIEIKSSGNWTNYTGVLGTFMNAGQFQGKGEKYLAIRFLNNSSYNYGWLKLYCSQHSDTLRIIEFAYNINPDQKIKAGQKE